MLLSKMTWAKLANMMLIIISGFLNHFSPTKHGLDVKETVCTDCSVAFQFSRALLWVLALSRLHFLPPTTHVVFASSSFLSYVEARTLFIPPHRHCSIHSYFITFCSGMYSVRLCTLSFSLSIMINISVSFLSSFLTAHIALSLLSLCVRETGYLTFFRILGHLLICPCFCFHCALSYLISFHLMAKASHDKM